MKKACIALVALTIIMTGLAPAWAELSVARPALTLAPRGNVVARTGIQAASTKTLRAKPAIIGDIDSDGYTDVVVGAPTGGTMADYEHHDSWCPPYMAEGYEKCIYDSAIEVGVAYIYSGKTLYDDPGHANAWRVSIKGTIPDGSFGDIVAIVGDIDGDGFRDVAVSSRRDPETESNWTGAVFLFSGKRIAELMADRWGDSNLTQEDAFATITGINPTAIVDAGDVVGDGHDDLLVGNPNAHPRHWSQAYRGHVNLYSGARLAEGESVTIHRFQGLADTKSPFGLQVVRAGDLNGDGVRDIVISDPAACLPELDPGCLCLEEGNCPYNGQYAPKRGIVYAFDGAHFTLLDVIERNDAEDDFGNPRDGFGRSIAALGTHIAVHADVERGAGTVSVGAFPMDRVLDPLGLLRDELLLTGETLREDWDCRIKLGHALAADIDPRREGGYELLAAMNLEEGGSAIARYRIALDDGISTIDRGPLLLAAPAGTGSAIAVVDLNNDGLNDYLVGNPFFEPDVDERVEAAGALSLFRGEDLVGYSRRADNAEKIASGTWRTKFIEANRPELTENNYAVGEQLGWSISVGTR